MNRTAIKHFAVQARRALTASMRRRADELGVTPRGAAAPVRTGRGAETYRSSGGGETTIRGSAVWQRANLAAQVKRRGYGAVMDEAAYVWFKRLVAVRFLEVNGYLPSGVRALSSARPGKREPDLVTDPPCAALGLSAEERARAAQLRAEGRADELFRFLFVRQCRALGGILPALFEPPPGWEQGWDELLFRLSWREPDGVVRLLVDGVDEADFFDTVETIGWLYQYYNEERKNELVGIYRGAVAAGDLPAATQFFTPDWIVRYMVDNSLGRWWLERRPDSPLRAKLAFYLEPPGPARPQALPADGFEDCTKQEPLQLCPACPRALPAAQQPGPACPWALPADGFEDCTKQEPRRPCPACPRALPALPALPAVLDPCMGSGHILAYAFDLLLEIYRELGVPDAEAARRILREHLFGLDIDERAYELACFVLMMKARRHDPDLFGQGIRPNLCAVRPSGGVREEAVRLVAGGDPAREADARRLLELFRDADEYGSLLEAPPLDYGALEARLREIEGMDCADIYQIAAREEALERFAPLLRQAKLLAGRYEVVATNPPYLGKLPARLRAFVRRGYPGCGGDLFAVFIRRNFGFCAPDGYCAFMSPYVWMFLSGYEPLRRFLLEEKTIRTLAQLEYSAFEDATVPVCAFVLQNRRDAAPGVYLRLTGFRGGMEVQRRKALEAAADPACPYRYAARQRRFLELPGAPIAYWVGPAMAGCFRRGAPLGTLAQVRQGIIPGNARAFLRLWHEVDRSRIGFGLRDAGELAASGLRWFPYNKGGPFRRWGGNLGHVIDMEGGGRAIRSGGLNRNFRLRDPAFYFQEAVTWSKISSGAFSARYMPPGCLFDIAGCCVFGLGENLRYVLAFLNSRVAAAMLEFISPTLNYEVEHIKKLPILFDEARRAEIEALAGENVRIAQEDWDSRETSWGFARHPLAHGTRLADRFARWRRQAEGRAARLARNERRLDELFAAIYGLEPDPPPPAAARGAGVEPPGAGDAVRGLISYFVGCLFGRYSLDVDGVAYAGGPWDGARYRAFPPVGDNLAPLDGLADRFAAFLERLYGPETLEENLAFAAGALGGGPSPMETLRGYFRRDFYRDHLRLYRRRPVYWLFACGEIAVLAYLHRWDEGLPGRLLREHWLPACERAARGADTPAAAKRLEELRLYGAALEYAARRRIRMDLDDGVEACRAKLQGIEAPDGRGGTRRVDLLA